MKPLRGIALIALGVVLLILLFFGARNTPRITTHDTAAPASAVLTLSLDTLEGGAISLASYAGTPLVINAWASWCPFCVKELPDFAAVSAEFDGAVTVIAINRSESASTAKEYVDGLSSTLTDELVFLLDPDDLFYKTIGGFSMPETLFINAAGEIVVHKRGPMEADEIREHIEKIVMSSS